MPHQEILIHAGPHKTASSSTQKALTNLATEEKLDPYKWLINHKGKYHAKFYSIFSWLLINKPIDETSTSSSNNTLPQSNDDDSAPLGFKRLDHNVVNLDWFQTQFKTIWDEGHSIVIAAEILGGLSLLPPSYNIMDNLKYALPNTNPIPSQVRVVLHHRNDHVSHLLSTFTQHLYKHRRKEKGTYPETFQEWACDINCKDQGIKLNFHTVNALGMAEAYLRQTPDYWKVTIVDMKGVLSKNETDLSWMTPCEIMNMSDTCHNKAISVDRRIKYDTYLSDDLRVQIQSIFQKMDCSYQYLKYNYTDRFDILYETDIFDSCDKNDYRVHGSTKINSSEDACFEIQNVLQCSKAKDDKDFQGGVLNQTEEANKDDNEKVTSNQELSNGTKIVNTNDPEYLESNKEMSKGTETTTNDDQSGEVIPIKMEVDNSESEEVEMIQSQPIDYSMGGTTPKKTISSSISSEELNSLNQMVQLSHIILFMSLFLTILIVTFFMKLFRSRRRRRSPTFTTLHSR